MVFGEFEWQTQNLAEYQVNVNILGTMRITRELMPIIRQNGSRIIVVSSHCAADPLPGISVYGATKAALHAWTTALRTEVGKYGVNVVSFIPGQYKIYCIKIACIILSALRTKTYLKDSTQMKKEYLGTNIHGVYSEEFGILRNFFYIWKNIRNILMKIYWNSGNFLKYDSFFFLMILLLYYKQSAVHR